MYDHAWQVLWMWLWSDIDGEPISIQVRLDQERYSLLSRVHADDPPSHHISTHKLRRLSDWEASHLEVLPYGGLGRYLYGRRRFRLGNR